MKFYITTAIDYPNSVPHLGHAYEKVVADFYARWYRLQGAEVRFLTGLDEHGEKIQEAARAQGESPQQFVDRLSVNFRDLWTRLEISNDDFIRTSEPRHQRFAAEFYQRVAAKGDTYRGFYEGDYCVACETFYTRTQLKDGVCPVHGTPTTRVKEESYFFRLGKYRDWIREHIQNHPEFVYPTERRNELLSRLEDEVRDLSISRSTFDWGIPLPDDPKHVLYVWFDALINYLSALQGRQDLFEKFWPADVHLIGKDIIWFHAVVWPAMLHSAGYPLPKQVMAHGFILDQHGVRMSKTLGNVVDPVEVVRDVGPDVLRYYFLRTFSSGQDGAFSVSELRERYANELGNDLGNLVMRVAKLATGKLGGTIGPRAAPADLEFEALVNEFSRAVEEREHHRAMDVLWTYIRRTNGYLNAWAPWKIEDPERLADVIYNSLEALRAIAHLLSPAMPATAKAIAGSLGFPLEPIAGLRFGGGSFRVTLSPPLFPRREEPTQVATAGPPPAAAGQKPPASAASPPSDPFSRLEIRVGLIREVQAHPAADALYVLSVELGGETRTICAGLRKHLTVEDLRSRKVVVLANLKPAKLRGVESQGMVLATDRKDGKVAPVDPGAAAPGELVCAAGVPTAPKPRITIEEFQKAPLLIQGGKVVYRDPQGRLTPLFTPAGELVCDAEDGAVVR